MPQVPFFLLLHPDILPLLDETRSQTGLASCSELTLPPSPEQISLSGQEREGGNVKVNWGQTSRYVALDGTGFYLLIKA